MTAYEPPHLLAYSWGEDHLRWELEPRDGGTRLVLTHTFDDRLKAARDAAGWDLCLDALATSLSGGDAPPLPESRRSRPAGKSSTGPISSDSESRPSKPRQPPSRVEPSDTVAPLLMFTGNAEDAMRFYVSVFFPARIERIERYGAGEPGRGDGQTCNAAAGDSTIQCIDSPIEHPSVSPPRSRSPSAAVRGRGRSPCSHAYRRWHRPDAARPLSIQ